MSKDPMKGHKSMPMVKNSPKAVTGASPKMYSNHAKLASTGKPNKKNL